MAIARATKRDREAWARHRLERRRVESTTDSLRLRGWLPEAGTVRTAVEAWERDPETMPQPCLDRKEQPTVAMTISCDPTDDRPWWGRLVAYGVPDPDRAHGDLLMLASSDAGFAAGMLAAGGDAGTAWRSAWRAVSMSARWSDDPTVAMGWAVFADGERNRVARAPRIPPRVSGPEHRTIDIAVAAMRLAAAGKTMSWPDDLSPGPLLMSTSFGGGTTRRSHNPVTAVANGIVAGRLFAEVPERGADMVAGFLLADATDYGPRVRGAPTAAWERLAGGIALRIALREPMTMAGADGIPAWNPVVSAAVAAPVTTVAGTHRRMLAAGILALPDRMRMPLLDALMARGGLGILAMLSMESDHAP